MAFDSCKITEEAIALHGIQGKANKLPGPTAANKLAFDELVTEVVAAALNGLIDALMAASAASSLGITPAGGLTSTNLQDALEEIMASMQAITQGSVADGSITDAKLAADAVTTGKILNLAVTAAKLAADAVTAEKILAGAVTEGKIASGAVTEDKLGAGAVSTTKLAEKAVTGNKIGDKAVGTDKLGDSAVTTGKIKDGAVTAAKLASSLNYAAIGLFPEQVTPIYVQANAPTSASADGIYLVTG